MTGDLLPANVLATRTIANVSETLAKKLKLHKGYRSIGIITADKDEYLTRPDKGRRFDEANGAVVRQTLGQSPKVALVVGDGLSSAAIEATAPDCMQAIQNGLKSYGIQPSPVLFVQYCRVGASDHIVDLTGAEVV